MTLDRGERKEVEEVFESLTFFSDAMGPKWGGPRDGFYAHALTGTRIPLSSKGGGS